MTITQVEVITHDGKFFVKPGDEIRLVQAFEQIDDNHGKAIAEGFLVGRINETTDEKWNELLLLVIAQQASFTRHPDHVLTRDMP
jgi:hypothetical protein